MVNFFRGSWAILATLGPLAPAFTLQELMLHETAVSWIRLRLARSVPAKAWEETREQYTARLKAICREINDTLDVEGLCRALPAPIAKLVERQGDRLDH